MGKRKKKLPSNDYLFGRSTCIKSASELKAEIEEMKKIDFKKLEEELIAQFGKKGVNFNLCRCPKATVCQDQRNRKVCATPTTPPKEYQINGQCIYGFRVRDGMIWIDEQ